MLTFLLLKERMVVHCSSHAKNFCPLKNASAIAQGCKSRAKAQRCVSLVPSTSRRFKHLADLHTSSTGTSLYDIEDTAKVLKMHAPDWPSFAYADYSDWGVRHKVHVHVLFGLGCAAQGACNYLEWGVRHKVRVRACRELPGS